MSTVIRNLSCCVFFMFFSSALASKEVHEHMSKEIGVNTPIPKIQLTVFRDAIDGVNVHIEVENYRLNAPNMASSEESNILQGHAHVFVNAEKKQRLYGKDIHIPAEWLKEGVNQIAISLNSHQHENWIANKQNIVSSVFIDLDKPELVLHHFTSQPLENPHAHH